MAQLKTAQLGTTGLDITRVGFGAWAIGGDWAHGWGSQDDDESIATINRALELGVNWIDTAAAYGVGHSEEVVGRAIAGLASKPFVFTKCSLVDDGSGHSVKSSLKRDSVLAEAEASVRRLGVDAIDLYQIHWPRPAEEIEEGWAALAELKEQGLVRHIGTSNFSVAQLQQIQKIAPVESIQPRYSLIDRSAEPELLPFAEEQGIGAIVYSPMGSGLLTGGITKERMAAMEDGDWRKSAPHFQEPQLSENLAMAGRIKTVATRYGTSPGAVAVAWTLRNPAVDGAITGFRRPSQVDAVLVDAANLELTSEDVAEIEG
jgi:aryl-alcohol dehydrogenase-like predicted oxidoreductase